MKTTIINQILELKNEAISKGHDFPTEDPENATSEELESFLDELKVFLEI